MSGHDIVVIGASAGGINALRKVVAGLPRELPAAVFVTLHITPHVPSVLPKLFERVGTLPVSHPSSGERFQSGQIYIAPPDRHLLFRDGAVVLSRAPKENGTRPAADPMFRSAAREFGPRVIGVVLSGGLDDGTAGLGAIRARGGATVAQAPASAQYPDMPRHAIEAGVVDYTVALDELADCLTELVNTPAPSRRADPANDAELAAARVDRGIMFESQPGVPSAFTCPDCGGVLQEIPVGRAEHFRCQVGHAWSQHSLLAGQLEQIEESLWAALRALEEHAKLTRRVRDDFKRRDATAIVASLEEKLRESEHHAREIRKVLLSPIVDPAAAEEPT